MTPASSLESLRECYGTRYKWIALAIVMIGTVASLLSSTIVNVTLPHLAAHFRVGNPVQQRHHGDRPPGDEDRA